MSWFGRLWSKCSQIKKSRFLFERNAAGEKNIFFNKLQPNYNSLKEMKLNYLQSDSNIA